MKKLLTILVYLLVAFGAVACQQGTGRVEGALLVVESCSRNNDLRRFEPFALDLEFMAMERDEDVVMMRFHRKPTWDPIENDSITLTLEDYRVVRTEIDTAGSTSRTQDDGVRIGLVLLETCPASTASMIARTVDVTFDDLSVNGGDRVAFTANFDLFDERTGEQVGWDMKLTVDFEVKLGTPYQQFSDPSSQH